MSTTLSVDDYFDELISLIYGDYKTMSIEEARELTYAAIREEYALNSDMTPEQLCSVISDEIDAIYANGRL